MRFKNGINLNRFYCLLFRFEQKQIELLVNNMFKMSRNNFEVQKLFTSTLITHTWQSSPRANFSAHVYTLLCSQQ